MTIKLDGRHSKFWKNLTEDMQNMKNQNMKIEDGRHSQYNTSYVIVCNYHTSY